MHFKRILQGIPVFALTALLSTATVAQWAGRPQLPTEPNAFIADVIAHVSDSAVASMVKDLESFGTRYFANANRHEIATWIRDTYLSFGVQEAVIDSFFYSGSWQKNVVATIPGTTSAFREIVVGGHSDATSYDANLAPGADDNASGTSAAMEMARVLRLVNYTPRATLRFLAFAGEEQGLLGSFDYARKAKNAGRDIVLMQNYDMIGHRIQTDPDRDVRIVWYPASEYEARLDSAVKRQYTSLTPVLTSAYRSQSDSYPFWAQGYRAVFNIEMDFSPYYHTPFDLSDTLDFAYAADIIRSGLALLLTVDGTLTGVGEPVSEIPSRYELSQNYPNPFNPTTNIRFQIPPPRQEGSRGTGGEFGWVTLSVYDLLGREVAVLVNETKPPGIYETRFDGSGLSSGVYLYRLTAGTSVLTRKMTLVK